MNLDWRKISDEHCDQVWGIIYRIVKHHDDALDCYQDVLIEAFQIANENVVTNLPGLLRWLAVKRSIDLLRCRNRAQRRIPTENVSDIESSKSNPSHSMELVELLERVRAELTRLPDNQAEAFWLCCVEQISHAEVAEQLNTDKRHIAVLVHRARKRLSQLLADLSPSY